MSMVDIREWTEVEAARLAQIGNSRLIFDNMSDGFPFPYEVEDAKRYINRIVPQNQIIRAIIWNELIVGNIGIYLMDDIYRENGRLAYFLGVEYWNKGIMSSAIRIMCKYAFESKRQLFRIYADPFERNIGSRKVLEKCGFHLDGIMRENVLKNGERQSSYMYSILRSEV